MLVTSRGAWYPPRGKGVGRDCSKGTPRNGEGGDRGAGSFTSTTIAVDSEQGAFAPRRGPRLFIRACSRGDSV
jgi:hypothetical protein